MATKVTGLGDNFYIGGSDISGDINSLSSIHGGTANQQDTTDITQSGHSRLGLERDGGIDFAVYFDPTGAHPVLSALPTADVVGSYFRGTAIGNPAASMVAKQINYDWTRGQDGSLLGAVSLQSNGFGLEWGQQLTPGHRVDGAAVAAGPANSFDTGGSLAFGVQMYVQLFAFAGTSVTISLWDSADNITFLAVAGVTTTALVAGVQTVRIASANNATVRRYLAVATVGTFSNADFAVMVNKNAIAGQVF
jgi:hypothetical protein